MKGCTKKVLIVSICDMRANTIGLIGKFLDSFKDIDKSILELSLFDIGFFDIKHDPSKYPVDHYYKLPSKIIEPFVRKIPKIRSWYAEKLIIATFRDIVKNNHFDAIILYHIPICADCLSEIAHYYNSKIIFYPGGSDILRVGGGTRKRLMKAFDEADYVVGAINSNTIIQAKNIYKVPEDKLRLKRNYISGIKVLMDINRSFTREEMSKIVGLPYSDYNIVCSYNGNFEHRHKVIIEALKSNIDVLPQNYQAIFPVTYGGSSEYVDELRKMCNDEGLNAVFITSFLTNEQMAYLHLMTDLFIEIQPTDAGNAFLIEALFSKNQIITGSWLNYVQFEQFGVPYHLIDNPNDLAVKLNEIFTHKITTPSIPPKLLEMYTIPHDYHKESFWKDFILEL
jgi:hypothetical protein